MSSPGSLTATPIPNVCIANCKFCNFYRRPCTTKNLHHYHRTVQKRSMSSSASAANSCCCRAILPPGFGAGLYTNLFRQLKEPCILHSNCMPSVPPEIAHITKNPAHIEVLVSFERMRTGFPSRRRRRNPQRPGAPPDIQRQNAAVGMARRYARRSSGQA